MTDTLDIQSFRDEFPLCREYAFFNHCVMSPLPACTISTMKQVIDELLAKGALSSDALLGKMSRCRKLVADLIGARPSDVAFTANTTTGVALVATGLLWQPGDNVVTADLEYPGNVYPYWEQQRRGVELRWVKSKSGRLSVDDFAAAIDERTRVLAVSFVEFSTGFRNDLARLGQLCADRGVLFVVDGIQGIGALELDVKACNVAVLASGSRKWLFGPSGVGFFYCRPDVIDLIGAPNAGAFSVRNVEPFLDYDFELKPDAGRFMSGGANFLGVAGLAASLELLNRAGIRNVQARVKLLTDRLCEGLRARGYNVCSSREEGEWSGIVCFDPKDRDGADVVQMLLDEKIVISYREGLLRVGTHFYNTFDETDHLVDCLP